jgi:hypothetical protein
MSGLIVIIRSRRIRLAKNLVRVGEIRSLQKDLVGKPDGKVVKAPRPCTCHEGIEWRRGKAPLILNYANR